MQLVGPATIACWTALNYHGMTEPLPRSVSIATNHPVMHAEELRVIQGLTV
jgi:predicted transcriptional regulator of viral defense system